MADVISFETTQPAGKTIRFFVDDLTDVAGQAVTSGAGITINLYDQNDVLAVTGSVSQNSAPDDDTYYADITLPSVSRTTLYKVKASGTKNGANYRDIGHVWVTPF